MPRRIGVLGFGEVGFHLCRGLISAGVAPDSFVAYYPKATRGGSAVDHAHTLGLTLTDDPQILANRSDLVLSVVVPNQAEQVAITILPYLSKHLYVDMNSTSPKSKQESARQARNHGISFVDVAILGSVARYEHRVPLMASGPAATEFATMWERLGGNVRVTGAEIGDAARFKMLRSAYSKGLALLTIETLLAAQRAGLATDLIEDLAATSTATPFAVQVADIVRGTLKHAARQSKELTYVIDALDELHVESNLMRAVADGLAAIAEHAELRDSQDWEAALRELGMRMPHGLAGRS